MSVERNGGQSPPPNLLKQLEIFTSKIESQKERNRQEILKYFSFFLKFGSAKPIYYISDESYPDDNNRLAALAFPLSCGESLVNVSAWLIVTPDGNVIKIVPPKPDSEDFRIFQEEFLFKKEIIIDCFDYFSLSIGCRSIYNTTLMTGDKNPDGLEDDISLALEIAFKKITASIKRQELFKEILKKLLSDRTCINV